MARICALSEYGTGVTVLRMYQVAIDGNVINFIDVQYRYLGTVEGFLFVDVPGRVEGFMFVGTGTIF